MLAALIALAAFIPLLFTGATAAAEDPVDPVIVGNFNQSVAGSCSPATSICAQGFMTGENEAGYRVTRIDIEINIADTTEAPNMVPNLAIWSTSTRDLGTFGHPGALLTSFSPAGELVDGVNSFDYDGEQFGIFLEPNTQYFVTMNVTGKIGNYWRVRTLRSGAQIESGALPGWGIDERGRSRANTPSSKWGTGSRMKIRLYGIAYNSNPTFPDGPTAGGTVIQGTITKRLTTIDENGVITETGETHTARICWVWADHGFMRIIGGSGPCPGAENPSPD